MTMCIPFHADRIDYARRAEKAALDVDPRITNSEGGTFDAAIGYKVLANSHGFIGDYQRSYCSVSAVPSRSWTTRRCSVTIGTRCEFAEEVGVTGRSRQLLQAHVAAAGRTQGEDREVRLSRAHRGWRNGGHIFER